MVQRILAPVLSLIVVASTQLAGAQQAPNCSFPEPPLSVHRNNVFTPEQEQWLGDAQAERVEPGYLLLPADKSEYLTLLGKKLLSQLPPTPVQYSFRIFESGEVRTFSLAGGHVYVSRKLLLDARNEDEVAGALAYEIGRIYTHHTATVYTLAFDKLMGIKSIADRADLNDKFQRMLNIPREILEYKWNPHLSIRAQEQDELLADRVGFYAMVKAGYAPQAYDAILDRANLNEGFKGNLFTDALDMTDVVSLRVRNAEKMIGSLIGSCRDAQPRERMGFKAFQDVLLHQVINPLVAATPGLKAIALDPPMNPALENVRLSPDAKFLLAQDSMQIHILSRAPLKLLFSIDAPGAQMAQFTPDSADVVFYYRGLRFEDWNVATGKRATVLDFADYADCLQASLSPDGRTFACFSRNYGSTRFRLTSPYQSYGWLKLSDVRTGKMLYENDSFYLPNFAAQAGPVAARAINQPRQAAVAWSQDGRYFLAASGTASLAFDLSTGKSVGLGNALSHLYEGRFAFVEGDKLAFECDWGYKEGGPRDTFKMCYTTFPEGNPLSSFTMGRTWIGRVTGGPELLTGPAPDAAATLFDPATTKAGTLFKLEPVDLAAGIVAAEAERGGVMAGPLGGIQETVALPATPLTAIEAGRFSADGRFLALADRGRGAVWDLSTGKQVSLSGPFRNAAFDSQNQLQARVATHELKPAREQAIDRRTGKVAPTLNLATEQIQYGSVLLRYKPLEQDQRLDFNVAIEATDAAGGSPLWSKHFGYNPPLVVDTDGEQLLLLMDRRSMTAGSELDHHKALAVRTSDEFKELTERGMVVEVISRRTGEPQRLVVAPEAVSGPHDGRTAALFGNLLAVVGNSNNTVVYRLSDGARLMAFFGQPLAGDSGMGVIAATNRRQEVAVYEVATGRQLAHVTLDHDPLVARFVPEKRQLLVVSATQRVYALDVPGSAAAAAR